MGGVRWTEKGEEGKGRRIGGAEGGATGFPCETP